MDIQPREALAVDRCNVSSDQKALALLNLVLLLFCTWISYLAVMTLRRYVLESSRHYTFYLMDRFSAVDGLCVIAMLLVAIAYWRMTRQFNKLLVLNAILAVLVPSVLATIGYLYMYLVDAGWQ